ncbi:MAG: lipase family protein [Longimicrobiales bacterium]
MVPLSPKEAAEIARGVYRLRTDSVSEIRERGQTLGCEGIFQVGNTSRFEGSSGGLFWKQLSGFGYIAAGEGARQGEVLVATRGTAMAVDWLTNLNIGFAIGPSGQPVHAGFNATWKSFSDELRAFLRNRNPAHFHCVGHSLGGALANLNADFLSASGAGGVSLYTFGAPRAGFVTFSRALSQRLKPENIYRVSNVSDPVPMIPLFPFSHAPFTEPGITLRTAGTGIISVAAHNMQDSYQSSVAETSWRALRGATGPPGWDVDAKVWLQSSAAGQYGVVMGSAKLLIMIGKALQWVLGRVKDILLGTVGTALAVGVTCLDQIAWLLSRGAEISLEIAGHVRSIIGAIFRFLGRVAATAANLTMAFLRWVLDLLFTALSGAATRALSFLV